MLEAVIILCVVGALLYVHKVGLPAVVGEIRELRSDIMVATSRHATTVTTPPKPTIVGQVGKQTKE